MNYGLIKICVIKGNLKKKLCKSYSACARSNNTKMGCKIRNGICVGYYENSIRCRVYFPIKNILSVKNHKIFIIKEKHYDIMHSFVKRKCKERNRRATRCC